MIKIKIKIRDITKENQQEILNLHVKSSQISYVETVEECLLDAKKYSEYRPVGLYYEEQFIGFAMYGFFEMEGNAGRVWLDRYFIDEQFQGKGFGTMALKKLLDHLESIYHCKEIYLSLFEDNQHALHLYQKFGFSFNGELDINGEKTMVKIL